MDWGSAKCTDPVQLHPTLYLYISAIVKSCEYLLSGVASVCKEYVCPRITHHMLSTLIPLMEVMAVEGTLVSIISLVF